MEKTKELLLQFREVKRQERIPSAGFHHLATAIQERCDLFVTIDERHIPSDEMGGRLSLLIKAVDPIEALGVI